MPADVLEKQAKEENQHETDSKQEHWLTFDGPHGIYHTRQDPFWYLG
jgi:hypothetical protein